MSFLSKAWHVPGYSGHIPTKREEVGKTFGAISVGVVASDSVARSRYSRTAPEGLGNALRGVSETERLQQDAVRDHERKREGTQLRGDMVVGYSGHVPRAREHLGSSYSKINACGIAEHEVEQHYREEKVRHNYSSMEAREIERQHRLSTTQLRNFNTEAYHARRPPPTFTPRVTYTQTLGVMPGASIFVPEKQETNLGRSYARATQQSCMSLRGKQVAHNTLTIAPTAFVRPVKAANDLSLSLTRSVKVMGDTSAQNRPVFEKKSKSQFVF